MIKRNNNPHGDSRPRDYQVYFGGIFLWEEKQNIVKKLNWKLLKDNKKMP